MLVTNHRSRRSAVPAISADSAMLIQALEPRTLFAAVPFPFTGVDIGATSIAGTDSYNGTAITITAAAQDAFSTADAIHYVYAKLIGNGSILTRVDDVNVPQATLPLCGLDIRSSLDPTAQNVFIANRGDGNVIVNHRDTDGGNGINQSITASTPNPVFVELQRTGDVITELYSTTGSSYTTLGTTTLTGLPTTCFIGFAQGSQNPTVASTGAYDEFSTAGEVVSAVPGAGPTATASTGAITSPTYSIGVTYASQNYVSAASLGNGNIVVTGPNGYSQPGTIVNAPGSDATSTTVNYTIPTPITPGTYTITLEPNSVSDAAGNFTAGQVLGTFTIPNVPSVTGTVTNAATGAPLAGVRVFFDLNHDGVETSTDPWALTDSLGDYVFGPASNGTYRVTVNTSAGLTVATPTAGYSDEATVLGTTQTGVNFAVDVPATAAGSLAGAFTSLPAAIKAGKSAKVSLTITNASTAVAKGTISIELASNATAESNSDEVLIKTFKKTLKLAAGASATIPTSFTISKKSMLTGNRYLVALIDTTHKIQNATSVAVSASAIPFS